MAGRRGTDPRAHVLAQTPKVVDPQVQRALDVHHQAILDLQSRRHLELFTATEDGYVPASGVDENAVLHADGVWRLVGSGGSSGVSSVTGTAPITASPTTGAVVVSLNDNGVSDAKLRDSAGTSVIGRASNTLGDPADIVATADGQILTRVGGTLQWVLGPTGTGTTNTVAKWTPDGFHLGNSRISDDGTDIVHATQRTIFDDGINGRLRFVQTGSGNFIQSGVNGTGGSARDLFFTAINGAPEWGRVLTTGSWFLGHTSTVATAQHQSWGKFALNTPPADGASTYGVVIRGTGGAAAIVPVAGTLLTLENAGSDVAMNLQSTTNLKRIAFGNSTNAQDGFIDYDGVARGMRFRTAGAIWTTLDSVGVLTHVGNTVLGDTSSDTLLVNGFAGFGVAPDANAQVKVDAASRGYSVYATMTPVAATSDKVAGNFSAGGTYDCTATFRQSFGVTISATSTRSAGANGLINYAAHLNAANAQVNYALYTDNGDMWLHVTSGNTGIGQAPSTAQKWRITSTNQNIVSVNDTGLQSSNTTQKAVEVDATGSFPNGDLTLRTRYGVYANITPTRVSGEVHGDVTVYGAYLNASIASVNGSSTKTAYALYCDRGDVVLNGTDGTTLINGSTTIDDNLTVNGSSSLVGPVNCNDVTCGNLHVFADLTVDGNSALGNANADLTTITGSLTQTGSGNTTRYTLKNTGTGGREWLIDANATAGGAPNALSIFDNTAGAYRLKIGATTMTINNAISDTVTINGAATINANSSGNGLTVSGSATDVYSRVANSAAGGRSFLILSGANASAVPNSFSIYDETAGAHRFTINSSGNVRVGTVSPTSRLHVSGETNGLNDGAVKITSHKNAWGNITSLFQTIAGGSTSTDKLEISIDSGSIELSTGGLTDALALSHAGDATFKRQAAVYTSLSGTDVVDGLLVGNPTSSTTSADVGFSVGLNRNNGNVSLDTKVGSGTLLGRIGGTTNNGFTNTWLQVTGAGSVTFPGNVTLGDASADTHTLNGNLTLSNSPTAGPLKYGSVQARIKIGRQIFTANGTYTPTTGTKAVLVREVGAGGGGGGVYSSGGTNVGSGGGGASGAYFEKWIDPATDVTGGSVTIGAAGAAGSNAGGNGGTGGDSSVVIQGTTYTAKGGGGGAGKTTTLTNHSSAGGAIQAGSSGGDVVFQTPGFPSVYIQTVTYGGNGAGSPFGGGGTGKHVASGAGGTATGYGAGGGGALSNDGFTDAAGGAGTAGLVIIEEYA